MALDMLDAMLQELQDEDKNATENIRRDYEKEWKNVATSGKTEKAWPCPRCFSNSGTVTGILILLSPTNGVVDAKCNKCGWIINDFHLP